MNFQLAISEIALNRPEPLRAITRQCFRNSSKPLGAVQIYL